jgi:predicted transcriptional regulator
MHAHTDKQDAIEVIEQLPDNVPMDEIVYRLYVVNKVRRGMQDVEAGRGISSEELAREIEQW